MASSQKIAQVVRGKLWVHFKGQTFVYENSQKKNFGKKAGSKSNSGVLLSPMPGKITKVFREIGDAVSQGDPLIVMEAMKMEYTLKADISGVIEKIDCQVGDQVVLGRELLNIKEEQR